MISPADSRCSRQLQILALRAASSLLAVGLALGDGFGEVDLLVGEQVPEQVHIGQGVAEALGDDTGGQPFDKGGSQGLIAALPFVDGPEEEALVAHGELIRYGGYNVNT